MANWDDLTRELDAWDQGGISATFWWRDDDAGRVTPALERLLTLSEATEVPVSLAVIPRDADDGLRERLARQPAASVLQHGWSHANHAPDGRQEEFGLHRPLPVMLDELARGWRRISGFDRRFPVFVAPWNRMEPHLLRHLCAVGLCAVSTLGPRDTAEPCAGVRRTNVHVDILDWSGSRGFVGLDRALDQVITHLRQRRIGEADAEEPTGLMTHHNFHDEGCWGFIEDLLRRSRAHSAVRWLDTEDAFWA